MTIRELMRVLRHFDADAEVVLRAPVGIPKEHETAQALEITILKEEDGTCQLLITPELQA